jgi:endonuclease YncB( thermonuclease family)
MRAGASLCGVATLFVFALSSAQAAPACTGFTKVPSVLRLDPATVFVVDGDTIREHRDCAINLRFNDIDAPDRQGHEKCPDEGALGDKSYERLLFLVRGAKTAAFHTSGEKDKWGRPLGQLFLDGKPVGQRLVSERLACVSKNGKKENWCAKPMRCSAEE